MAKDIENQPSRPKLRIYVQAVLTEGAKVGLSPNQAHYLQHVMRCKAGDEIGLFNGQDGEWLGRIDGFGKGWCSVEALSLTYVQRPEPDLWYLFAPVKRDRLDYMVQKATEIGVSHIMPVLTRHTMVKRINNDRLLANAVEAAEQCGRLSVPEVLPEEALDTVLDSWQSERRLIFCDEGGDARPLARVLTDAKSDLPEKYAILIGPEGGFDRREREILRARDFVIPVTLGPRILRADTAAVTALSLWQGILGDWS